MNMVQKNKLDVINNYFDKIYVLTLKRATERHLKIKEDLVELRFTFFYGFDKLELDEDTLLQNNIYDNKKAKELNRYNRAMKLGEIACSMGHKAIYENIVLNNLKRVLILEDDVIIKDEGLQKIESIFQQLPNDWDILYFDYNKNENSNLRTWLKKTVYHIQKKLGLLKWSQKTINNLFAKSFSNNLKISGYHDYTSAYAITQNAAKKLIKLQTPISFPSDNVLSYAITNKFLNGFISIPKVFEQQSQSSKETVGSYVES